MYLPGKMMFYEMWRLPFYFKPLHCFKLYRDNGSFPCSWHMSGVCAWCVKCLLNPSLWLLKVILMECFSILHPFYHAEVEKRYSNYCRWGNTYQNSLGPLCAKEWRMFAFKAQSCCCFCLFKLLSNTKHALL